MIWGKVLVYTGRVFLSFLVLISSATLLAGTAAAQTTIIPLSNGGSLSYTVTSAFKGYCAPPIYDQREYSFGWSSAVYTDPSGNQFSLEPLSRSGYQNVLYTANYVGVGKCPENEPPGFTWHEDVSEYSVGSPLAAAQINFYPQICGEGDNAGDCSSATIADADVGYVNPKYVVVGVTYAPPGHASYVDYSDSSLKGTTVTTGNTFSYGVTVTGKFGIASKVWGIFGEKVTITNSNSYTQESDDSTSHTVEKEITNEIRTPGGADDFCSPATSSLDTECPPNHDYDIIWLWLNPSVPVAFHPDGTIQWLGFGFSSAGNQVDLNVYPVYVGWLNGDLPLACSPQGGDCTPLQRNWASAANGFQYAPGDGPALTTADFQQIEQADPYWSCSMASPPSGSCPLTGYTPAMGPPPVDLARFTPAIDTPSNLVYQQAAQGAQPQAQSYKFQYTDTTTQNQGTKHNFTETFGVESDVQASGWWAKLEKDITVSWTWNWGHTYNKEITSSTTSVGLGSISGPTCSVDPSTGLCNPLYTGAVEFDLYEDVLFGTFMFNPRD